MADQTPTKRLRDEKTAHEEIDGSSSSSSSKRHKPYNNILNLLDDDDDFEPSHESSRELSQDLSAIFTTLQNELSSNSNSNVDFGVDFDSIQSTDAAESAEPTSRQADGEGLELSVMRHLLEASDDELGLPNRSTDEINSEIILNSSGEHVNFSLGFNNDHDGLWEIEDEVANYYTVLQSDLFM